MYFFIISLVTSSPTVLTIPMKRTKGLSKMGGRITAENLMLFMFILVVTIWAVPIWFVPGLAGIFDWNNYMLRYEAIRRTVLLYHQWPGHNAWMSGGAPLLGHPLMSLLSINGLLTLVFGTYWGLKLGALMYLFIGFFGSWKLSGLWWRDQFIRGIFSFYIISSPPMAFYITAGVLAFMTFWFMPMLFYFLLRFREDRWSGLKAAIVLGVAVNDSVYPMVQYSVLLLVCTYVCLFLSNWRQNSRPLLRWGGLFVPVVITLTFYRVITMLQIALDYPRISNFKTHFELGTLVKLYFYPYTDFINAVPGNIITNSGENACYVGAVCFALAVLSLRKGFSWWHAMLIVFVWACSGNDSHLHIMYWIQKIPTFSSIMGFQRVRVFVPIFLGIAGTWGLNLLWSKYKDHNIWVLKYLVMSIGILMIAETLIISHIIMTRSHVRIDFSRIQNNNNPDNKFRNISTLYYTDINGNLQPFAGRVDLPYYAIKNNLGWIRGYSSAIFSGEIVRVGRDEPGYVGEFHQNRRPVEPAYWSPNRILLKGLEPNVPLVVNINPGRPWYCNNQQLFSEYRIVENSKPFQVMPDENGVVELTYRYPGQKLGIWGTIFWLVVSVVVVVLSRNREKTINVDKCTSLQCMCLIKEPVSQTWHLDKDL